VFDKNEPLKNDEDSMKQTDNVESASPLQLVLKDFRKHRAAIVSLVILAFLYLVVAICGFLAPYTPNQRFRGLSYAPPTRIHFFDEGELTRPFVYDISATRDPVTLAQVIEIDEEEKNSIYFFFEGEDEYKFMGLFETRLRLFGTEEGNIFLLGTDNLGRDIFSRVLIGTRISLSVGLLGVILSLVLGIIIGGISGFYGGTIDNIIQRVIEFLLSIPQLPLWMALAAALPDHWTVVHRYFAITIILSILGWTGLARVVRGKLLSLRDEDFVAAARASNGGDMYIILRHLIPNFMSYILVNITLAIPTMIIGETSLSFLGLGLQPPAISWGVLLQGAQQVNAVAQYPWLLTPAIFVIIAILAFNFVGDGLRDAADPYN